MIRHLGLLAMMLFACLLGLIAFGARAAGPADELKAQLKDQLKARQGSVTYVDFWASWCGPCAESFPWLNQMQARYGAQGLKIVGIGLDTEVAKGDRFVQAHAPAFAIIRDPAGSLAEFYGVEGMPYSVLIDADGNVLHRHTGFRPNEAAEYERAIQSALAAKGVH